MSSAHTIAFPEPDWLEDALAERRKRQPSDLPTVSELFARWFAPQLKVSGNDARTLADYSVSVRYFGQFFRACQRDEPSIDQLDEADGHAFNAWLMATKELRETTAHKHCRNVETVISTLGKPPEHARRCASKTRYLEKLDRHQLPTFAPPKPQANPRPPYTREMAGRLSAAARLLPREGRARLTAPNTQPVFFRALILVDWNTGLRKGTLLALRWEWLIQDEHGHWFHVPAGAMKNKAQAVALYVNQYALQALDTLSRRTPRVFPWKGSESQICKILRQLCDRADVPHYGTKGFRRSHADTVSDASDDTALGAIALGHAQPGTAVLTGFYAKQTKRLARVLDQLPQPIEPAQL